MSVRAPLDPFGEAVKDYLDVLEGKKPAAEAQVNGEQELTNEQRRRVPYIIAMFRTPCYLCEQEPPCHFFLPWKTADVVTPWKITAICKRCKEVPNVVEQIKTRLMEELYENKE
jgi:hypothetical protein